MTCIIASASDRVAGWRDREVPVGRFRGPGPDRIHHDNLRAATLRLAYQRPEVEVRDDRVRPPQHDVPAVDDLLRIDSGPGSDGGREAGGSDRAADMAIEAAAPHRTEQPRVDATPAESAPARLPSCTGRIASAPDSSTIAFHRDAMSVERLVPSHADELPLALVACRASAGAGRDRDGRPVRDSDSPWRRACRG